MRKSRVLQIHLPAFLAPLGSALAAVLAFLAGVHWATSQLETKEGEFDSTTLRPAGARPAATKAAPEDFYPAAEHREQSALLLGCYENLQANPRLYVDIARAIDGMIPLFGLVTDDAQAALGRRLLRENGLATDAMHFLPLPADTIWIRDYAPFIVRRPNDSAVLVDAKYQGRKARDVRLRDEEMALELGSILGLPVRSIPLVLEGGNFLSNGDGAMITSSLTYELNRQFDFTDKQIGDMLHEYFGLRHWTYVRPLDGEPTGHVDMFVALLAKNLAVVGTVDAESDPTNAEYLDLTASLLSEITTSLGPMRVHRIPMPPKWARSWRSYTNIIMANGLLLMPSYSDVDPALENEAEAIYRKLLPGWKIARINCDGLVKQEGQLHCISYNVPKYVSIDGLLERARLSELKMTRGQNAIPPRGISPLRLRRG